MLSLPTSSAVVLRTAPLAPVEFPASGTTCIPETPCQLSALLPPFHAEFPDSALRSGENPANRSRSEKEARIPRFLHPAEAGEGDEDSSLDI
jgi:hypothetical protein